MLRSQVSFLYFSTRASEFFCLFFYTFKTHLQLSQLPTTIPPGIHNTDTQGNSLATFRIHLKTGKTTQSWTLCSLASFVIMPFFNLKNAYFQSWQTVLSCNMHISQQFIWSHLSTHGVGINQQSNCWEHAEYPWNKLMRVREKSTL